MSQPFMSICPRNTEYLGTQITGIQLRVVQDDGVEYNPHIKFTEAEMDNGVKLLHNNSGKSDSFKVTCLFDASEKIVIRRDTNKEVGVQFVLEDHYLVDILDEYIRNTEPFYITTRATGINNNDLWLITENKERKQEYDDNYVVWDLTFTKLLQYTQAIFKNTNAGVTTALNNYEKKKAKAKKKAEADKKKKQEQAKKKAESKLIGNYNLATKCNYKNLKYSKKKKVVKCVKYLQEALHKMKYYNSAIDGWYGSATKEAVKKFQKAHKTTHKLKVTGNIDLPTFQLISGQKGKTKTIKTKLPTKKKSGVTVVGKVVQPKKPATMDVIVDPIVQPTIPDGVILQ